MPLVPPAGVLDPRIMDTFRRRMNSDLIIQAPVDAADGQGGRTRTWPAWTGGPPNGEVLGAVEPLSAAEREAQGTTGETSSHLIAISFVAVLDPTGKISVVLPATDDPTTLPTGVTYTVTEQIQGASTRIWQLMVPRAVTPLDLSTTTPTPLPLSSNARVSTLTVDGAATFTAGPVRIPITATRAKTTCRSHPTNPA